MPFSLKEENTLNDLIVSLHPHKAFLQDVKPRFYVIRKGWGNFLRSTLEKTCAHF